MSSGGGPTISYTITCNDNLGPMDAQLGANYKRFVLPGQYDCTVTAEDSTGLLKVSTKSIKSLK